MANNKHDYTRHYLLHNQWYPELFDKAVEQKIIFLKNLVDNISFKSPCIDVGCAFGITIAALTKMGYTQVEGVDVCKGLVDLCRKRGMEATYTDNVTNYLKLKQNNYGLITCLDVIEHVPKDELDLLLHSIYDALRENGIAIFTVPNANSTIHGRWRYNDYTHITSFTETSLEYILTNADFRIVSISGYEWINYVLKSDITIAGLIRRVLLRILRFFQKLIFVIELGRAEANHIPLSVNLVAIVKK